MSGVLTQRSIDRVVLAVLLLIAGALPVAARAAPIVEGNAAHATREDAGPTSAAVVDIRELLRTAPVVSPSLTGIDDGFLANGNLLYSELRDQSSFSLDRRIARAQATAGKSDTFSEAVDDVLKAT